MPYLNCQYLDGRDSIQSRIQLTAEWLTGWKYKDDKWKFEEEVRLPHVDSAYFRCRVHLFGGWTSRYSSEAIQEHVDEIECIHNLDGVQFGFFKKTLVIIAPLNLAWTKTKNDSKNPCLFRETGQYGLALKPIGDLGFQILITYRNLHQLLRSEKMFAEEQDGFRWIGSPRHKDSGVNP